MAKEQKTMMETLQGRGARFLEQGKFRLAAVLAVLIMVGSAPCFSGLLF